MNKAETTEETMIKALRIASIATAYLVFMVNACVAADRVRISYPLYATDQGYLFVAIEKGYFAQEGVEVELVQAGGGVATPALMSGNIQFTTSASSTISAILRGAKLKVLIVGADKTPYQVWSTDENVKSFEDLRQQQVGVASRGDTGETALRYLIKAKGLPNDFISYTPLGTSAARAAAFASGAFKNVLLEPIEVVMLRESTKAAKAHLVVDLAKEVRIPSSGLATSDDMIKNNPGLVLRVVRALQKGRQFVQSNPTETVAILSRIYKLPEKVLREDMEEWLTLFTKDGKIPLEVQQADIPNRSEMLGISTQAKPETVFDFSFVTKVNAESK
jgi:NitT/TauT family transport system substrate-binding protein